MSTMPENLIDLGQYPPNDVGLIAREFLRHVYLDTFDTFLREYAGLDLENKERENIISTLQAFEHTIVILDGNEDFLSTVHEIAKSEIESGEEENTDDEFERF